MLIFSVTYFSIEYYETTSKHSAFVSKHKSYFESIALLVLHVFACVRHGVVVDQVASFFGLVVKLVLALSCCKKKQNKEHFYRCTIQSVSYYFFFLYTEHRSCHGISRPMDAGFPCDKAVVLGATIKEKPCSINLISFVEICCGYLYHRLIT